MIQLNLLPDVKGKYIKTMRLKRLVFGGSIIAIIAALSIVGILSSVVYGAQKVRLKSLDTSIKASSKKIAEIKDLDKILTIQNQLNSLTSLHDKKAVTSRLFEYLPQLTPNDVSISNFNIKFGQDSGYVIVVTGTSKSLEATNKFVDTLKFTKFTIDGSTDEKNAFSEVVLTSFGRTDKESFYTVTMKYDPALFDSQSKGIKLLIPKQITTQSTTQRPEALFKQPEGQTQ